MTLKYDKKHGVLVLIDQDGNDHIIGQFTPNGTSTSSLVASESLMEQIIEDRNRMKWLSSKKFRILGGGNSIFIEHKPGETDFRAELDEVRTKEGK